MVLKAWHMTPDTDIVSQFDLNFAGGEMKPDEIEEKIGVAYHQVTIFFLVIVNNK